MTKLADVKVGQTWVAKVGGNLTRVKLTADRGYRDRWIQSSRPNTHQGWDAINLTTGKKVHIKSAQKLRRLISEQD